MADWAPRTLICGWAAARQAAPLHASAACLAALQSAQIATVQMSTLMLRSPVPCDGFKVALCASLRPSLAQAAYLQCSKLVLAGNLPQAAELPGG